jgi:hydroxymethylpyrimidine pyrophosphatase-like HAD family hydrolase
LKLFEIEGIKKENVVAFGDGWNDLEMLQIVGEGVAMGNADEELKKIVGRTCDTNDNDGIAKYLEKYL